MRPRIPTDHREPSQHQRLPSLPGRSRHLHHHFHTRIARPRDESRKPQIPSQVSMAGVVEQGKDGPDEVPVERAKHVETVCTGCC